MKNFFNDYQHLPWEHPYAFVSPWIVGRSNIDHYQHTNNVAYLSQLEALAWQHSNALGLQFSDYQHLNRAMVITKHELNYLQATHLNNEIACATWIVCCDNKFRLQRKFQFIDVATQKTCFTAATQFVCVDLTSGAPKRMPSIFTEIYGQAAEQFSLNIGEPPCAS
ncbi:MAG: acyl-CoA thioesterase [Glaciecola sp.]